MQPEHLARLLTILSCVDQFETMAGEILSDPVYIDIVDRADELRETAIDLRGRIERHLASGVDP